MSRRVHYWFNILCVERKIENSFTSERTCQHNIESMKTVEKKLHNSTEKSGKVII